MSPTIPPRALLLACGTLALTIYCWTAAAAESAPQPLGTLLHTVWLGGTVALFLVAALATGLQSPLPGPVPILYRATSQVLLALLVVAAAGGIAVSVVTAREITRANPEYSSDASAFNHFNAQLVLQGVNPYTANQYFWAAIAQFPHVGATPLERGRYAGKSYSPYGPGLEQIVRDVRQELAEPATRGPEYDPATLHSYPALAFLVYLPNVWAGWPSTAPTTLLFLGLFLLAAAWRTPPNLRLYVILIGLANQFLLLGALRGEFEAVAYFPAILAWSTLDRRWLSPALLGLASAVKQIIWPLVPLYGIIVWRREGGREAVRRLGIAALGFLLPNLPFLLLSPGAWARSLLLPISLPLFPSGIGLIELTHTGLLPVWPPAVYAGLELGGLGLVMLYFARAAKMPRPELAPLLSLLPFLLAYRSLLAYFLVVPVLALYAVIPLLRRRSESGYSSGGYSSGGSSASVARNLLPDSSAIGSRRDSAAGGVS